jgi:co-chaperonin GroES (HSP10)
MRIKEKIIPLKDRVFISDMNFDAQTTKSGLVIRSTDGKEDGIVPRWGKVWAIGPEQKDVKVGEWIMVEHGRWTRGVEVEQDDGSVLIVRMVDADAIMMVTDEKPEEEIYIRSK